MPLPLHITLANPRPAKNPVREGCKGFSGLAGAQTKRNVLPSALPSCSARISVDMLA